MAAGDFTSLARLAQQVDDAENNIYGGLLSIAPQIVNAMKYATSRTAASLVALGQVLDDEMRNVRRGLISVNAELAAQAQEAILTSYDRIHDERAHSNDYRTSPNDPKNRRYAGGQLRSALADPSMVQATYDGIALINRSMLYERAAQWRRLNFGAGEESGSRPARFNVSWSNLVAASFGLDEGPADPFTLPEGYFLHNGDFYPQSELPERESLVGANYVPHGTPTKGIEAWNFLDAGVQSLAENMPKAYQNLYNRWYRSAVNRAKGPLSRHFDIAVRMSGPSVGISTAIPEDA